MRPPNIAAINSCKRVGGSCWRHWLACRDEERRYSSLECLQWPHFWNLAILATCSFLRAPALASFYELLLHSGLFMWGSNWRYPQQVSYYHDDIISKYLLSFTTNSVVYWSEFLATGPDVPGFISALPDLLRKCKYGTGFTRPREDNWGAAWKENSGSGLENRN
jgi:hypothetical protein